jgi:hypothetical protein
MSAFYKKNPTNYKSPKNLYKNLQNLKKKPIKTLNPKNPKTPKTLNTHMQGASGK